MAESVEPRMAASSRAPITGVSLPPKTKAMNRPVSRKVRMTPSEDSSTPWRKTGRVSRSEVLSPASNRMKVTAKWHRESAVS